jgi:hypothetical protein
VKICPKGHPIEGANAKPTKNGPRCRECANAATRDWKRAKHGWKPRPRVFYATIEDRFWAKVNKTDSCWLWTGTTQGDGYGQFRLSTERRDQAHRVAHEWLIGPIPPGYEVDHLCFVPACVNPAHLEAVTPEENKRRRRQRGKNKLANAVVNP